VWLWCHGALAPVDEMSEAGRCCRQPTHMDGVPPIPERLTPPRPGGRTYIRAGRGVRRARALGCHPRKLPRLPLLGLASTSIERPGNWDAGRPAASVIATHIPCCSSSGWCWGGVVRPGRASVATSGRTWAAPCPHGWARHVTWPEWDGIQFQWGGAAGRLVLCS
jgi:hypothetical protein